MKLQNFINRLDLKKESTATGALFLRDIFRLLTFWIFSVLKWGHADSFLEKANEVVVIYEADGHGNVTYRSVGVYQQVLRLLQAFFENEIAYRVVKFQSEDGVKYLPRHVELLAEFGNGDVTVEIFFYVGFNPSCHRASVQVNVIFTADEANARFEYRNCRIDILLCKYRHLKVRLSHLFFVQPVVFRCVAHCLLRGVRFFCVAEFAQH